MDKNADALFEYLRDVIYDPAKAGLTLDSLDPEFRDLGRGLQLLTAMLGELREFSVQLGRGNLDVTPPGRGNPLVASLKSLQANLRHMTWQTQQVANGDYQQKVDFLGGFSEAFNTMTMQLDHRQQALLDEIDRSERKTLALAQNTRLLETVTDVIPQWIFVMPFEGENPLFINVAARDLLKKREGYAKDVLGWIRRLVKEAGEEHSQMKSETAIDVDGERTYISAAMFPVQWREQSAVAVVLSDISEERNQIRSLESVAYRDALTKVYSRHYGMRELRQLIDDKRKFCICFVDVDGLKYVNDTFGHPIGDEYIIAVARELQEFHDGMLCRLGGDEFMLLSKETTHERMETAIGEIRSRMIRNSERERYTKSISYGVYEVGEDNILTESELLSVVDDSMYRFKRAHKRDRKVE